MTPGRKENINTWLSQINTEYKTAVSVDCVILGYDESDIKVLLLKCDMPPYEGLYSLVGDLVRPSEDLDMAAERILRERGGMKNVYMEQVQSFSKVDRHPLGRVITIAYYSLIRINDYHQNGHANPNYKWINVKEIKELAFDHMEILQVCLNKLQKQLREHPIGFNLLPQKFTLKELQTLYEVILGIKLDKRNFRRKLLSQDLLIDLKETQTDVAHRPAKLYSFDQEKYAAKIDSGFTFDI